jgi:hypothetical protein
LFDEADQSARGSGLFRAPILHPYGVDGRGSHLADRELEGGFDDSGDPWDAVGGRRRHGAEVLPIRRSVARRRVDCPHPGADVAEAKGAGLSVLRLYAAAKI